MIVVIESLVGLEQSHGAVDPLPHQPFQRRDTGVLPEPPVQRAARDTGPGRHVVESLHSADAVREPL
ncbi:hypothetical protein AXK56_21570 [Tsukamurella pulmonis]|nr:hypothetical protein AXK56_21570 [Tsukamurella pulmonis]